MPPDAQLRTASRTTGSVRNGVTTQRPSHGGALASVKVPSADPPLSEFAVPSDASASAPFESAGDGCALGCPLLWLIKRTPRSSLVSVMPGQAARRARH